MNIKMTIIIGLPGSGKTELAKKISYGEIILDDLYIIAKNAKKNPIEILEENLKLQSDMIITDPVLCYEKNLEILIRFLLKKKTINQFIIFEKDFDTCHHNIINREDQNANIFIQSLKNIYDSYHLEKTIQIFKKYQQDYEIYPCYQKYKKGFKK